jgi:hypothetical protein
LLYVQGRIFLLSGDFACVATIPQCIMKASQMTQSSFSAAVFKTNYAQEFEVIVDKETKKEKSRNLVQTE